MENTKSDLQQLSDEVSELVKLLRIEKKKLKLKKLEGEASDPSLWNDQKNATKLMQEIGDIKKELEEVEQLMGDIKVLKELSSQDQQIDQKDVTKVKKQAVALRIKTLLSDKHDQKNAIVSIHAGQGGTEAMDWVSMLYRMYLKFCEKRGWKTEELDRTDGEEAGIKSVTLKVVGSYAYGYLRGEAGTHRLVRQSPFNADKLRQTSFALVEILPELGSVDLPDIEIKDEDVDWQFFRSSGKGGQNVNKVSTAVRLTHKPSGIVVTAQTERSQTQNRNNALNLLRARLWLVEKSKSAGEKRKIKGEYRPASWGTQIRSYVLHPYKMVKDLRTNIETNNPQKVLDGDLDEFVEAELKTIH